MPELESPETHVVLGANGGIGSAVVRELVGRGLPVRAVTRRLNGADGTGVEHVAADLVDPAQARHAVEGAAVVYHAANPPYHRWDEMFPPLNRSIIEATGAAGARLVFADNLYMYGPGAGVMSEDTAQRASDKKGRLRASLAQELLDAHTAGTVSVAIGRAPDYFGPGGLTSAIGARFFDAALDGGNIRWLGDPDAPHSVSYLPDLAAGLVTLGTEADAPGRVWHLPTNGAPTGREFAAAASDAVGRPLKVTGTPRWLLRALGLFSPQLREVSEIMYQWEDAFVSSDAEFQAAFGPRETTSLDEAMRTTLDWFARRNGQPVTQP